MLDSNTLDHKIRLPDEVNSTIAIMTPSDHRLAGEVLAMFDAASLGDGDLAAGANTLAAMALTIAAVQNPSPAFVSPDGSRTAMGGSFLVSGPLSSSLIQEHVIGPLREYQTALSIHVRDWLDEEKRQQEHATRTNPQATSMDQVAMRETQISHLIRTGELDFLSKSTTGYQALMNKPPGFALAELRERSLVFASAASPQSVLQVMAQSHCGRPLIHVPLTQSDTCHRFSRVCNRLLDGSLLSERVAVHVRGELIITDPGGVLSSSLREGGAGADWLSRLLWLSDHVAHPAFEAIGTTPATAKLDGVVDRFRSALKQAWATRVADYGGPAPEIPTDFQTTQASWVKTLISLESALPGASSSLRPLVASLTFGLYKIYGAGPKTASMFTMDKVVALATMLALRMANVRAVAIHDERRGQIEKRAAAIRLKLDERPHTAREMCRRFSKLLLADCEEALGFLANTGAVRCDGDVWHLAGQSGQTRSAPKPLVLNV